jgi:hypothetical protein
MATVKQMSKIAGSKLNAPIHVAAPGNRTAMKFKTTSARLGKAAPRTPASTAKNRKNTDPAKSFDFQDVFLPLLILPKPSRELGFL